jgi:arylsulfatase A-like enzyme
MSRPPSILWIVTTQWRASATGYAGDPNARTSWLDGFASVATNYSQTVTPHPFGPQARAALLTGKLSPTNGVRDYWDPLPIASRTIAHALNDRGYTTGFFGKWHLSERSREVAFVGEVHARTIVPPERRGGFSHWEGFESGFLLNDPWLHGSRLPEPTQFNGYQADVLAQRAASWLKSPQSAPAFCIVSLEAPHPPYQALAPHVSPYKPEALALAPNVPLGGEVERKARQELAGYYAHVEAADRAIGKLLAELDLSETIVVFTSVHGDMHGAHGLFRKGWPYEDSVRVPLLIKKIGSEQRERLDDSPVSLVDLPHMALAWAEGREWICRRDSAAISLPAASVIPLQCDREWYGFRSAKRKLILNADRSPWLYFDLEHDPWEMNNLVTDFTRRREIEELRLLI